MKKLIPLIFVIGIGCSKEDIKPVDGKWTFQSQVYSITCSFNVIKSGGNYNFSSVVVDDNFYPASIDYIDNNARLRVQSMSNKWIELTMPFSYDGSHIIFKNVSEKTFNTSDWTNGTTGSYDPKIIATRVP